MSSHAHPSNKLFFTVWSGLLVATIIEVGLAYMHLSLIAMLTFLLGLSFAKAGLIVAYFMHLRYEKLSMTMTLIPATLFCIGMMFVVFPDSLRLLELAP